MAMRRVAYYTHYQNWLGNRMFDLTSDANANDVLDRWVALRAYLLERGIELNTFEQYPQPAKVDLWLMQEPTPDRFKFLLKHRIPLRRTVFLLHEPPVINPWGWKWLWLYRHLIGGVLTWHSGLCATLPHTHHYHFPVRIDRDRHGFYRSQAKKNLLVTIHANKTCHRPGELYSLRRDIIRYYERRGDALLDLYGYGWNDPAAVSPFHTPLYRGTTPDKRLTFSQYRFVLCIDNSVVPGYITYDPFLAMATGSVPIYLPMPDAAQFIPDDVYVNYRAFPTLDALTDRLLGIAAGAEYEAYRQRGWEFVAGAGYRPFTIGQFCEDMYRGIAALGKFT